MKFFKRIFLFTVFFAIIVCFGLLAQLIKRTQDIESKLILALVDSDKHITKAYFSPDDDLKSILIDLISCEKKQILTAMYTITDKDIAEALVDAHKRGIKIECVVDRGYGADQFSKVPLLANNRLPIWVYQDSQANKNGSLMHNKFCVFKENILCKSILWTGSYNFTRRATLSNQENIVILDNEKLCDRFSKQFEIIKDRSLLISGEPNIVKQKETEHEDSMLIKLRNWFKGLFSHSY